MKTPPRRPPSVKRATVIPLIPKQLKTVNTDHKNGVPELLLKWAPAITILFTALLYSKSIFNDFTGFDDDDYVLNNLFIRNFSWEGVRAIFSSFHSSNYHPFTTLCYLFLYKWFGLNPLPYHLLNVLLHLINIGLVYKLSEKLSGQKITAVLISFLFAIHPLQVESVAWVSELKTVLYSVFYLLSLLGYLEYMRSGFRAKYYIASILIFTASLLSKSAAVTLPLVLVAIDVYKGRTINFRSLMDKIPFLLLSVLFGIVAIISQGKGNSLTDLTYHYNIINRLFLFTTSLSFYIVKLAAPFNLSAMHYYPDLNNGALPWLYYVSLPFLFIITWLSARRRLFRKEIVFGVAFFLLSISVMLQIISVGVAYASERYVYISYIGLFYIAGQWTSINIAKEKSGTIIIAVFAFFAAVFSILTWNRIDVWKDTEVLFTDIIEKNQNSSNTDIFLIYHIRGTYRDHKGDKKGAIEDYNEALRLINNIGSGANVDINPDIYLRKAHIYDETGNPQLAINAYNQYLKLAPASAIAYNERGRAYFKSGDSRSAMLDFNKAIAMNRKYAEAFNNRGWVNGVLGNTRSALLDYDSAILFHPQFDKPYFNRGTLKAASGDFAGAVEDYTLLLKLQPENSEVYYYRGLAYLNNKDTAAACNDWKKATGLGYQSAAEMVNKYCR